MNEAKGLSGGPGGATEAPRQDDAAPSAPAVFESRRAPVADQRRFDEKLDRDRGLNAGQAPETRQEVGRSLRRLTGPPPRRGAERPRSDARSVESGPHRGEEADTHATVPTDHGRSRVTDRPGTDVHPRRLDRNVARSGDAKADATISRAVPAPVRAQDTAVRRTATGSETVPVRAQDTAVRRTAAGSDSAPLRPVPPDAPTSRQSLPNAPRPAAAKPSQGTARPSRPVAGLDAAGADEQPAPAVPSGHAFEAPRRARSGGDTNPGRAEPETTVPEHAPRDRADAQQDRADAQPRSAVPSGEKSEAARRARSLDEADPGRAERETTVPEHTPQDRAEASAAAAATASAVPDGPTVAAPVDPPGAVAAAADRAAVVREVVDRVLVSRQEAGASDEVRVTLASSVLDGSSIRLSREDGELKVVFEAATEGAMRFLADNGDSLRQALAQRLPGELVRVDVTHEGGASADDAQGRARQRYVAPDDDAAELDPAPPARRNR